MCVSVCVHVPGWVHTPCSKCGGQRTTFGELVVVFYHVHPGTELPSSGTFTDWAISLALNCVIKECNYKSDQEGIIIISHSQTFHCNENHKIRNITKKQNLKFIVLAHWSVFMHICLNFLIVAGNATGLFSINENH